MTKLVALKRLCYPRGFGGVEYNAGDKFEALSDRDAKALTLVRAARIDDGTMQEVQSQRAKPSSKLVTQNMQAEQPETRLPVMTTEDMPSEPKKRYLRRDLRSED